MGETKKNNVYLSNEHKKLLSDLINNAPASFPMGNLEEITAMIVDLKKALGIYGGKWDAKNNNNQGS